MENFDSFSLTDKKPGEIDISEQESAGVILLAIEISLRFVCCVEILSARFYFTTHAPA